MLLRFRDLFLGVTMCAASAGYAAASDVNGNFAIRGIGSAQCGQYTATYEKGEAEALRRVIHWMQGYLSARNKATEGVFDTVPAYRPEDLVALLNAVCVKNPEIRIEAAANGVFLLFEPTWFSENSELSVLEEGGQRLPIRKVVLGQVQQALSDEGFYDASVDGVYGKRSVRALKDFQEKRGIAVTGLPDLPTLLALLVNEK